MKKTALFAFAALILGVYAIPASAFDEPPCPGEWREVGVNPTGAPHFVCDLPPRLVGPPPRQRWGYGPRRPFAPAYGGRRGPMFSTAPVGRPVVVGRPVRLY